MNRALRDLISPRCELDHWRHVAARLVNIENEEVRFAD